MLTWCTESAYRLLADAQQAPQGLPCKFLDFGGMFWAHRQARGIDTQQVETELRALRAAQAIPIAETDDLISAIADLFNVIAPAGTWTGTPTDLKNALAFAGASLSSIGKGRAIANRLREGRRSLELYGIKIADKTQGNNTVFTLTR